MLNFRSRSQRRNTNKRCQVFTAVVVLLFFLINSICYSHSRPDDLYVSFSYIFMFSKVRIDEYEILLNGLLTSYHHLSCVVPLPTTQVSLSTTKHCAGYISVSVIIAEIIYLRLVLIKDYRMYL